MRATRFICVGAIASLAAGGGELWQNNPLTGTLQTISSDAMQQYNLKSLIVQVRYDGKNVYTQARGESMAGVPATPRMHFRNGAMAFTYMSTMLLELIDKKPTEVSLDEAWQISAWASQCRSNHSQESCEHDIGVCRLCVSAGGVAWN
jgi:hypothetical protein